MIYNFRVENLFLKCTNSTKMIITDSVKYHIARFEFDKDWDNYSKTIVFTNSYTNQSISVLLDEKNECVIPWEVLEYQNKNAKLIVGVQGVSGVSQIWTCMEKPLDFVRSNKSNFEDGKEPTEDIYSQILEQLDDLSEGLGIAFEELDTKGSSIDFTEDGFLALNNNGEILSSVEMKKEDIDIDFSNIFEDDEDSEEDNGLVEGED